MFMWLKSDLEKSFQASLSGFLDVTIYYTGNNTTEPTSNTTEVGEKYYDSHTQQHTL